jgi:hypothetical protein
MVLLETFDGFLCLLEGGNGFLECDLAVSGKEFSFVLFDVGLYFFLIGFSLFLLSIGRLALHFLNEFVGLTSLLLDLNHLHLQLFLESQHFALSFIQNLKT